MRTLTVPEPQEIATLVEVAIRADMRRGVVPTDVQSFSDLHDWVDANVYLIDAHEALDLPGYHEDLLPADNAACELVNKWLDSTMLDHRRRVRNVERHPYVPSPGPAVGRVSDRDRCAHEGCGLRERAPAHH